MLTKFKEWVKRGSTFTDWCIAAFTCVLAFAAIYQFTIMKGQLDAMHLDQRAWIRISLDPIPLQVLSPSIGTMHIVNVGKTPARLIQGKIAIQTLAKDTAPALDYNRPALTFSTGIVFPSDKSDKLFDMTVRRQRQFPAENVVIIGGLPLPLVDNPISQTELEQFNEGNIFLVVYARVAYSDASGEHWTQFCRPIVENAKSISIPAKGCTDYNDTDHN